MYDIQTSITVGVNKTDFINMLKKQLPFLCTWSNIVVSSTNDIKANRVKTFFRNYT